MVHFLYERGLLQSDEEEESDEDEEGDVYVPSESGSSDEASGAVYFINGCY